MGQVLPSYLAKAAARSSFHFTAFVVTCGDRKSAEWHEPLLRRLLDIFNSAGVQRTYMEGQRLYTSSWDHKFPPSFQFPIQLTDKLVFQKGP